MTKILSKATISLTVLLCISIVALYLSIVHNKILKNDLEELQESNTTLLNGIKEYKVLDSLNAVEVGNLTLKLSDYMKAYQQDQEVITALKKKNHNITSSSSISTNTITEVEVLVHDTLIDSVQLKCFDYYDSYLTISGCIDSSRFKGTVESVDSLVLVSQVKYKRFLGFLWKTKKIKSQSFNIVSKNPHTKINDFRVVTIK